MSDVIRELSFDERSRYGDCPVCSAKHGQACDGNIGIPFGRTASGLPPTDGAHVGRLNNAPRRIREVPA